MKSNSEKVFENYYITIRRGITSYFRRNKLTHLGYEDCFHDVITPEILERKIASYKAEKAEGKTLEQWVIYTFIREVLSKLRSEMSRSKLRTSIDFSDAFEENKVYKDIEKNIEYFTYENDKLPVFIPDFMISNQMQKKLISHKKITGERIEINIIKLNLQQLRRSAWTSEKLLTEKNFEELTISNFSGLETPLHFDFNDPMPVIKLKCWVACSNVERY